VKIGFSYGEIRNMDEAEFYAFVDILIATSGGSNSKKKTYLPANEP